MSADLAQGAGPAETGPAGTGPAQAGLAGTGLVVLAGASWPAQPGAELPTIAGFVQSSFSPLAAALADSCLSSYFGPPPADPPRAERTAIVLASATGDISTAAVVAAAIDGGTRVPPLMFYQANPNAVAGHIAARWGLTGPVVATIPAGEPLADALASATLLIEDGDADAAVVIVASQGSASTGHARSARARPDAGDSDHGQALLIGPASWQSAAA